jgi:hypothetical protein
MTGDGPIVQELLAKSFASLVPGGMILVHDAHINAAKAVPLPVAALHCVKPMRSWSLPEPEWVSIQVSLISVELRALGEPTRSSQSSD